MIASPSSGAGKTIVSIGLMGALARRGLKVQPFKVGPDFIDPSLHTALTGRLSRNLDVWLTSNDKVKTTFQKTAADADVAVIEGVMGLYDGISTTTIQASTAHIASLLKAPILLTVDVHGMARSAAAVVDGFINFEPRVKIQAVVLNKVGSPRHFKLTSEAVNRSTKAEVVGGLPLNKGMSVPERHLGLIPANALNNLPAVFKRITDFVEENIRVAKVLEIARRAP
ncbi:MAG: cobyrinate a,c-diamide synthase, partial [Candidatus Bathyarchaeia archaeon]